MWKRYSGDQEEQGYTFKELTLQWGEETFEHEHL